jgi:hypothetical protein
MTTQSEQAMADAFQFADDLGSAKVLHILEPHSDFARFWSWTTSRGACIDRLRAELILEGANIPMTSEAEARLHARGVSDGTGHHRQCRRGDLRGGGV